MGFVVTDTENYRLIKVSGFLDGRTTESTRTIEYLGKSFNAIDRHHVLDLSAVEYVNSTLMGQFVRFHATVHQAGYLFALLKPGPSVSNVLDMTGLSHVLLILRDESEIASALTPDAAVSCAALENVDYDQLESEIEDVLVRGDSGKARAEQLRKLRGNASEG